MENLNEEKKMAGQEAAGYKDPTGLEGLVEELSDRAEGLKQKITEGYPFGSLVQPLIELSADADRAIWRCLVREDKHPAEEFLVGRTLDTMDVVYKSMIQRFEGYPKGEYAVNSVNVMSGHLIESVRTYVRIAKLNRRLTEHPLDRHPLLDEHPLILASL